MPKSNTREEAKKEYRDYIINNARKAWNDVITYTFKELEKEAQDMYDSYIEQYYEYETKSYHRHNAGIGTGWGDNLYYGRTSEGSKGINAVITKSKNGFLSYTLYTNVSGDKMEKYRYNTTDEVLEQVMSGIRGVPQKGWWIPWTGKYYGKYFSYSGAMDKAFQCFDDNFNIIANEIFEKNVDRFINKYFK